MILMLSTTIPQTNKQLKGLSSGGSASKRQHSTASTQLFFSAN
jgi:hypothetical protein